MERVPQCDHRGALLRIDKCNLCGLRGQPFEVYQCSIVGECSLSRKHSKIVSCLVCIDRTVNGEKVPQENVVNMQPSSLHQTTVSRRQQSKNIKQHQVDDPIVPCDHSKPLVRSRANRDGAVALTAYCGNCGIPMLVNGEASVVLSVSVGSSGMLSS